MIKNRSLVWRIAAILSHLALLVWILLWNAWISPPYPAALVLLLLLTPLLFVLRGLLYARRHTYAWISLLSPFYFALGVSHAYVDSATRPYGYGLLLLSVILFASCIGFIRANKRHTDT